MDKLSRYSIDGVGSNIDRLAELFPQCVTEALDEEHSTPERPVYRRAVNFDMLRQLLSPDIVEGSEAYEFTWPGKKAAIVEANTPTDKTLRPCPAESVDWDSTRNLYIEGDNLEVLKLLQGSYMGKVKLIYIDPPYNTGNDFIYRDDFALSQGEYDSESGAVEDGQRLFRNTDSNGRFHSDWCSMIYARLLLARNLLSEDGVIFISIDENEFDSLKKICDEIFGSVNYRNTLLVRRRIKSLNSQFADNGLYSLNVGFEYVLVYSKSSEFLMKAIRMRKENASTKGRWDVFWSNADRPTMRYELLGFTPTSGQWRNSKEKADKAVANYRLYQSEFADKMTLEEYYQKTGISDFIRRIPNGEGKNGGVQHWVPPSDTMLRTSNWTDIEVSQIGKEIDIPFDNPKSTALIMELIRLVGLAENDIVMDFFSGSATTAHAVMQLNAEDGGRRRFIMVQLPEACAPDSEAYRAGFANICEIGKERIRRAAKKIREDAGMTLPQDFDGGFRVLRLDEGNFEDIRLPAAGYSQGQLGMMLTNLRADRDELDLLFGCLLQWNLPLSLPCAREDIGGCTVLDYNDGDLLACFDDDVPEAVIREMAGRHPLRAVFKDSGFADSPARINVEEIFKQAGAQDRDGRQTSVKVL